MRTSQGSSKGEDVSHYGRNITAEVNPGKDKSSRLQVFFQEDQSGHPHIRVTDVSYEFSGTKEELIKLVKEKRPLPEKMRKELHHFHLSPLEARELAAELLRCADYVENPALLQSEP